MFIVDIQDYFENHEDEFFEKLDNLISETNDPEEKQRLMEERKNIAARIQDPEEVDKELDKHIAANPNMFDPSRVAGKIYRQIAGDHSQETIGEHAYFIDKEGNIESYDLSDEEDAIDTIRSELADSDKLLVVPSLEGGEPSIYRYTNYVKEVPFMGEHTPLELDELSIAEVEDRSVENLQQLFEEYHVSQENQAILFEPKYRKMASDYATRRDKFRKIDERIHSYHSVGEQVIEPEVQEALDENKIPKVELDGMGLFSDEEMEALSICAGVSPEARLVSTKDDDKNFDYNDDRYTDEQKQKLKDANDIAMYLQNIYNADDLSRMPNRVAGFMVGNNLLMNAVQKAKNENNYDDLANIVKAGLDFYSIEVQHNGFVSENVIAQQKFLGKIGNLLDKQPQIAERLNLTLEQREELRCMGRVAENVMDVQDRKLQIAKHDPKDPKEKREFLQELLADKLLETLSERYQTCVRDMATDFEIQQDVFNLINSDNIEHKLLGQKQLWRVPASQNLNLNEKYQSPIYQAAMRDGDLSHLRDQLKILVTHLDIYADLFRMDNIEKIREAIEPVDAKTNQMGTILLNQALAVVDEDTTYQTQPGDEVRDFVAKSVLPLKFLRSSAFNTDPSLREQFVEVYNNTTTKPFENLKGFMDSAWDKAKDASLSWKRTGKYADMYYKLDEIRKEIKKNPDNINGKAMFQKLKELKEASIKYLAEKDGVPVEEFSIGGKGEKSNVTGRSGDKRYNAAYSVYLYAEMALRQEKNRVLQPELDKKKERRLDLVNAESVARLRDYTEVMDTFRKKFPDLKLEEIGDRDLAFTLIRCTPPLSRGQIEKKTDRLVSSAFTLQYQCMEEIMTTLQDLRNGREAVSLSPEAKNLIRENRDRMKLYGSEISPEKILNFENLSGGNKCADYIEVPGMLLGMAGMDTLQKASGNKKHDNYGESLIVESQIYDDARRAKVEEFAKKGVSDSASVENNKKRIVATALSRFRMKPSGKEERKAFMLLLSHMDKDQFVKEAFAASGIKEEDIADNEGFKRVEKNADCMNKIREYVKAESARRIEERKINKKINDVIAKGQAEEAKDAPKKEAAPKKSKKQEKKAEDKKIQSLLM